MGASRGPDLGRDTQTHHAPTPLLFYLSSRCQLSSIATSVLSSKRISSFSHSDFSLSIRSIFSTLTLRTILPSLVLCRHRLALIFTALSSPYLTRRITTSKLVL